MTRWLPAPGARRTGAAVESAFRGWMLFAFVFLYLPIVVVIIYSFNDSRYVQVWRGLSTRWYEEALHDRPYLDSLKVSLQIAVLNAVVATVLGTLLGVALAGLNRWVRTAVVGVMVLTIATPEVLLGLSLLLYLSKIGITLSTFTIMVGHVVFNTSIVAFLIRARLSNLDRDYEEAAADLGAPPWKVFFGVTVPLLSPAILAGALLSFTFSFDDYVLSFFTAGPQTLPLRIFGDVRFGSTPEANAIGSMIIVFSLAMVSLAVVLYRIRARQLGGGGHEIVG